MLQDLQNIVPTMPKEGCPRCGTIIEFATCLKCGYTIWGLLVFSVLFGGALVAGGTAGYLYLKPSTWRQIVLWVGWGFGGCLSLVAIVAVGRAIQGLKLSWDYRRRQKGGDLKKR
ncbi:MAG: hypothetical protein ACKVP0_26875 [Pirellulaceae bacterium]